MHKRLNKYGEQNYVPYFFLYLFDNEEFKNQRDELIKEANILPTAKNLYIKSVL